MPTAILRCTLCVLLALRLCAADQPCIDSRAIAERFATITAEDMAMLRGKRILLASRSFGLNLCKGLTALAQQDATYQLLGAYRRFDVRSAGDVAIIPGDAFANSTFVHFLATYYPLTRRLEEMDRVLRQPPHGFAATADAVIVFYHTATPDIFDAYAAQIDSWRAEFPRIRFICVTAGFMGPAKAKENEQAHAFSELVRARYRGKAPIYDMGAILSDDFRVGHVYCPEYSKDPADVHPNLPAGEAALAKGFLLVLRDAFRTSTEAIASVAPAKRPVQVATESLPADHPEAKAVRAILDANGLTSTRVDGVAVVRDGHVAELFLQEAGVSELPDAIGELTRLQRLHVYGDRNLPHRRLVRISPAIGRCTALRDLLLNGNELASLPAEISMLQHVESLSVGDNRLHDLPPTVMAWLQRFDPKGLAEQRAP